MDYFRRTTIGAVWLCLWVAGCGYNDTAATTATRPALQEVSGETMGTTYHVRYPAPTSVADLQRGIDSLLVAFNLEVSTYIDSSTISRFNQSSEGLALTEEDRHFLENLRLSQRVFETSGGAFDVTVMPVVNYWGFGYTPKQPVTGVDSVRIDSLLQLVGMDRVVTLTTTATGYWLGKRSPGVQLDFSAVAKGYGVDLVAAYLRERGINTYFVEIGGEVVTRGEKAAGQPWRVGINEPRESASLTAIEIALPLTDRAIATSGNYRNYYEAEGKKYSHTINPATGYPERSTLLSASVFASDCATADAYATTCMVLGAERALALIEQLPDLEAYLLVGDERGSIRPIYTSGIATLVEQARQEAQDQ